MKKRQKLKLYRKVYKAIEELNKDVCKELGFGSPTKLELAETYFQVIKNSISINRTLKDYKKYILKK